MRLGLARGHRGCTTGVKPTEASCAIPAAVRASPLSHRWGPLADVGLIKEGLAHFECSWLLPGTGTLLGAAGAEGWMSAAVAGELQGVGLDLKARQRFDTANQVGGEVDV